MSNIQTLIESGPDAFTNLYDVVITFPTAVKRANLLLTNSLSVRIQDFPFPPLTLQPYNISYKSAVLKRFAPKITGARKITLPIRLDADWEIYKDFKAWKKHYMNDDNTDISFGNFVTDASDLVNYGRIDVKAYDADSELSGVVSPETVASKLWKFYNVACINVQEPQFTREAANPVTLNVEFLFGVYVPAGEDDPINPST